MTTTYNQVTLSTVVSNQVLNFTEFELYDQNGVNIALLGTASQSSTFQTAVGSIAINGLTDGTIASGDTYNFASTSGGGTWTLDLAQSYLESELSSAIFYNRITPTQGELDRAIGMVVTLHSTDGLTSIELGVGTADLVQTFVITPPPEFLFLTPGIGTINIRMVEISGALSYRIEMVADVSGTSVYDELVATITTEHLIDVTSLPEGTAYTATMYADYGSGLEEADQEFSTTLTTQKYDQVVISTVSNSQPLHFVEFELYDQNGTNIALSGTASQDSTFQTSIASNGIDGYKIQGGASDTFAGTNGIGTWTLDLAQGYLESELNNAVLYNRLGSFGEESRFAGATITLVSSDGLSPVEIGVGTADLIQTFIITEKNLTITMGVSTMDINVKEVDGALSYRIVVIEDVSGEKVYEKILASFVTDYTKRITLKPDTAYTATLCANTGSGYVQEGQESAQTLVNSATNYDLTEFGGDGKYDLSTLGTSEFNQINEILEELFSTGETLDINISGKPKRVVFVQLGETVSSDDSVIAPFDSSAGSGQNFTLELSNASTTVVGFNEATNSIAVGGVEYAEGVGFILDGKKCYTKEI